MRSHLNFPKKPVFKEMFSKAVAGSHRDGRFQEFAIKASSAESTSVTVTTQRKKPCSDPIVNSLATSSPLPVVPLAYDTYTDSVVDHHKRTTTPT